MQDYHDDYSGKRSRHHPRSLSPIDGTSHNSHKKPRRSSYNEDGKIHRKTENRGEWKSPSRLSRDRSRSPEENRRRRPKRDDSVDARSRRRHHHTESSERRKRPSRHQREPRSPPSKRHRDGSFSPPPKRSNGPLPSQQAAFTKQSEVSDDAVSKGDAKPEKQKPNYAPSGLLAAETNKVANTNIVLKYNEPPESRLPPSSQPWRLYVFKNKDLLDTIPLHTRPCWLFGRETAVCDVAVEHPSASKQHAVLQFRHVDKIVGEFGEKKSKVGLYVIDLESANGTKLNGETLPGRRFVECKTGDMVQFGESTREYVVLLPPKD